MPNKGLPAGKAGIAFLMPLLLVAVLATVLLLLITQGVIQIPFLSRQLSAPLQTEYRNPFEKGTQYVNPFSNYKNPFDNLK